MDQSGQRAGERPKAPKGRSSVAGGVNPRTRGASRPSPSSPAGTPEAPSTIGCPSPLRGSPAGSSVGSGSRGLTPPAMDGRPFGAKRIDLHNGLARLSARRPSDTEVRRRRIISPRGRRWPERPDEGEIPMPPVAPPHPPLRGFRPLSRAPASLMDGVASTVKNPARGEKGGARLVFREPNRGHAWNSAGASSSRENRSPNPLRQPGRGGPQPAAGSTTIQGMTWA